MNILPKIQGLLRDLAAMVEAANVCDKAYADGTGHPDWHSPFTAGGDPVLVGMNIAGPQAVVAGIQIIAILRGAETLEGVDKRSLTVLRNIVAGAISRVERKILHILANNTWNSQQPLIPVKMVDDGKGGLKKKRCAQVNDAAALPLIFLGKMNVFTCLEADAEKAAEIPKDWHQIKAAASWFLDKLQVA